MVWERSLVDWDASKFLEAFFVVFCCSNHQVSSHEDVIHRQNAYGCAWVVVDDDIE